MFCVYVCVTMVLSDRLVRTLLCQLGFLIRQTQLTNTTVSIIKDTASFQQVHLPHQSSDFYHCTNSNVMIDSME